MWWVIFMILDLNDNVGWWIWRKSPRHPWKKTIQPIGHRINLSPILIVIALTPLPPPSLSLLFVGIMCLLCVKIKFWPKLPNFCHLLLLQLVFATLTNSKPGSILLKALFNQLSLSPINWHLCSLRENDGDLLQHFHPLRILSCESTPSHHLRDHVKLSS